MNRFQITITIFCRCFIANSTDYASSICEATWIIGTIVTTNCGETCRVTIDSTRTIATTDVDTATAAQFGRYSQFTVEYATAVESTKTTTTN